MDIFSDVNVQHIEEVATNNYSESNTSVIDPFLNKDIHKNRSITKQNKRKNIEEGNARCQSSDQSDLRFSSPPSCRLRPKKVSDDINSDQIVSDKKKKSRAKK